MMFRHHRSYFLLFYSWGRRLFLLLFLGYYPVLLNAASSIALEEGLERIIVRMKENRFHDALNTIDPLLEKYPNFQAGWVIRGDILNTLAGRTEPLELDKRINHRVRKIYQNNIRGYRDEVTKRLEALNNSAVSDKRVPSTVLQIADNQPYYFALDLKRARLFVLDSATHQIISDYYMSQGYNGSQKEREGDNRTPIGVYRITSFIPPEELHEFYGDGAYPINYPNNLDISLGRTGSGIWIHGVPNKLYSRPPLSSNGCVVISNQDLNQLKNYVMDAATQNWATVIVDDSIEWVSPEKQTALRDEIAKSVQKWQEDWQSLNTEAYLSHYDRDFQSTDGLDYQTWKTHKRRVNSSKDWIRVTLDHISIVAYPKQPGLYHVAFTQKYASSNFSQTSNKEQYWRKSQNGWRIVLEGAVR